LTRSRTGKGRKNGACSEKTVVDLIKWIFILLIVAAIASLLGFRGVAGASAGIAKVLIFIVLAVILLAVLFGWLTLKIV
jgi:uncharacterized membrane protein YtjA (UPF0391 family)